MAGPQGFAGAWRIVAAFDLGLEPSASPLIGAEVAFAESRVAAPHPLGCGGARFEEVTVPPLGLFQGAFTEEAEAEAFARAAGLGLAALTLRVDCDTGSFDYHVAGGDLLLMLDGVILRLRRP
jgi:hypothetical protein